MRQGGLENKPSKGLDRRTALKTIGTAAAGLASIGMTGGVVSASGVITDPAPSPPPIHTCPPGGCGGGNPTWRQYSKKTANVTNWVRHLGSGLEHVESDPGGTHDFRIAGDFSVRMPNGELPAHGSIGSQEIRIENLTPDTLAILTSSNQHENAMDPKPPGLPNLSGTFGDVTTELSVAAYALDAEVVSGVLLAEAVAEGLYGIAYDGGNGATKKWHSGYGNYSVQGGHHAKFSVDELGGKGALKIYSEVWDIVSNGWKLEFDYGLKNITPL